MRILQLTDELPQVVLGGSGRIAWETSRSLKLLGHQVGIVTAAPEGVLEKEIDGIRIYSLPQLQGRWAHYRSVFSRKRANEVLAAIRDFQPDIIHAHGLAWQLGYAWLPEVHRLGITCVYTAHGVMNVSYGKVVGNERCLWYTDLRRARWMMNPFRNLFIQKNLSYCKAVLCVSQALFDYLSRFHYRNLCLLHNGVDIDFWCPKMTRAEARTLLSLPQEKTIFLFAGRIGHDKGSTAVVQALPNSCHLVVAGETAPFLFNMLGDRVHFFPQQSPEQMRVLYTACDVTLVPSIYLDPFPTMCLESQACACPVIATTYGGASECVVDGATGWVLDPTDKKLFSERLHWCVRSQEVLHEYGTRARKHIIENFSQDHYCRELLKLYHSFFQPDHQKK